MPDNEDGASLTDPEPSPRFDSPLVADVLVPRHLHRIFTYRIPPQLVDRIAVGSFVRVPFGRTMLNGIVIARASGGEARTGAARIEEAGLRLRDIADTCEESGQAGIPPDLLALSRLVADYYLSPWGQSVRLIVPPAVSARPPARYRVTPRGRALQDKGFDGLSLAPSARDLLIRLTSRRAGLSLVTLRRTTGETLERDLAILERGGLIEKIQGAPGRERSGRRSSAIQTETPSIELHRIGASMPQRAEWLTEFTRMLDAARPTQFLLQASRTTRRAALLPMIEAVLIQNRQVLIIAPEVARAEAIAAAVATRWSGQVELFHSSLTPVRKRESWQRIRSGSCRIVVGTRSAIFVPLDAMGLIVVDDEDDASLKEETEPKYHARTVAWLRAQLTNSLLVLGSAHPSLETFQLFRQRDDQHKRLEVKPRDDETAGPADVAIVDLRREPYGTLLSGALLNGIQAAVERRAGAILFLNRKGFAPALICRDCGATPRCGQCSVALTFYKRDGRLRCHYCGLLLPLPDTCPSCLAPRLEPMGVGTEAVEDLLHRLFPKATIARVDRDTSSSRYDTALREAVARGDIDVLIGTQMLFQGWPLPPMGFVGLVHADAGLHLPDYRAGEQTYHTLSEAVALALPKRRGGSVILQTRLPAHHVIQAIAQHDPSLFYDQELAFRRALSYPPFAQLISLRVSSASNEKAQAAAEHWAQQLRAADRTGHVTVWGPVPSPLAQVRGKHRWQIAVKTSDPVAGRESVARTVQDHERDPAFRGVKFDIDVDPVSML